MEQDRPLRLTFVTDIMTPYMVSQFGALANEADLKVIFCSETGTRAMPWDLADALSFDHEVIDGTSLRGRSGGMDYHLSPRILAAIARSRPDAVIAAGYSLPTVYASIYCGVRRRPLVIHCEGTARSERILGRAQGLARQVLLRRAATCAATSADAAARFRALGVAPDRVFMAPHSTNLERMWQVSAERSYALDGPLRVLSVGRLIVRKGLDRLIGAAATARAAGSEIELSIVGTGPEEEPLRRLAARLGIADAVRFEGFVDQAGLPAAYAAADAFAFPSLRDPFGIVLLEAAAAGLPLVASPEAGATRDLVEHERSGLVVEPDDVDGLAQALARLADDRGLRERLGRAAHELTLARTPRAAARGFMAAVDAARRHPGPAIAGRA